MSRRRADAVTALIARHVAAGDFPGAAWSVSVRGRAFTGWAGKRIVTGPVLPVRAATPFDLASLTKPLATALVALRLHAAGRCDLEAPLRHQHPALGGARFGALSALDLMTHRSGLSAWRPFYLTCRGLDQTVAAIARARPLAPPRTRVVYSDLDYILLGALLERWGGASLAALFAREVARPLGVAAIRFTPPASGRRRCAATERANAWERAMAGAAARAYRGYRRGVIWGEVHDQNAYALGGAAGHAGLFGTTAAVSRIGRAILDAPEAYLPASLWRRLRTDQTRGLDGHRSAGLQLARDAGSSAGPALSADAIGHTGFTGTSLWIDPRREAVLVLLTNRMHPTRGGADMNAIRRAFHAVALARV